MPKSKWFRVATEGATTDGREITRADLEQMAKTYSRDKYGARVWLEHFRGTVPGGPFDALGDVLAVELRDVEEGKKAMFAQIEPLPALIEMNKKGQKIFSSIEIHPNLPTTGGAYLYGLAVTDSPASLGTEVLKFSQTAQQNPFEARKSDKATLFTVAQEFKLELVDEAASPPAPATSALTKFNSLLERLLGNTPEKPAAPIQQHNTAQPEAVIAALAEVGGVLKTYAAQRDKDAEAAAALTRQYAELKKAHDDLVTKLSNEDAGVPRPPAAGGASQALAQF